MFPRRLLPAILLLAALVIAGAQVRIVPDYTAPPAPPPEPPAAPATAPEPLAVP